MTVRVFQFLGCMLGAGEMLLTATATIAGAEVITITITITITVPTGWSSRIVPTAGRDAFLAQPERVLINGGYFDARACPTLLVDGATTTGPLRHESPYSGFVWADAAGTVHFERTGDPLTGATWAIQSRPLLVEQGRNGINITTSVALRSVIALRRGQVLVIHTSGIGLRELADGLVANGVETAINLDGGPSSALLARIAGTTLERPGTTKVLYSLGFAPGQP